MDTLLANLQFTNYFTVLLGITEMLEGMAKGSVIFWICFQVGKGCIICFALFPSICRHHADITVHSIIGNMTTPISIN